MDTLIMVGQFILSLSILIILHECGHFFPAKWFNTKVEKFYLFFDPWFSLWKTKKGDTEYGIGWLPLGGYVKIAGMIDESFDKEQMQGPPQPWEFRSKPAWQRLIIMLGGVTVNFILGILLFAYVLFTWGEDYLPSERATFGIAVDSLGYDMGLRDGDKIISIGEKEFDRFNPGELINQVVINNANEIVVDRNGNRETLKIDEKFIGELSSHKNQKKQIFGLRLPFVVKEIMKNSLAEKAGFAEQDRVIGLGDTFFSYYHEYSKKLASIEPGNVDFYVLRNQRDTVRLAVNLGEDKLIGVGQKTPSDYYDFESQKFGFIPAIEGGWNKSIGFLDTQIKAFGQIFKGKIKAKDSLGSFITIGKLYGTTWDWRRFWNLTAMLSVLLGFINLLPIPALDGGHVMFLLFEVITGIKPSDKVIEYATLGGFILLVLLMVYAIGLDISRLF